MGTLILFQAIIKWHFERAFLDSAFGWAFCEGHFVRVILGRAFWEGHFETDIFGRAFFDIFVKKVA